MTRDTNRSRLMRLARGVRVTQDFAVDPGRAISAAPESVPILINSFNRLSPLRELVESLRSSGHENLYVIDNASTYEPLLAYYQEARLRVFRLDRNVGYLAMWTTPVRDLFAGGHYVYTDCDVVPAPECPPDFITRFRDALARYPDIAKVGFGLKTDDLPDRYAMKDSVVEHERQFLAHPAEPGLYRAPIDTTFALYRPGAAGGSWLTALRTGEPYLARHLPWYSDSASPTEEELYYHETARTSTHWTRQDPDAEPGVSTVMLWGEPVRFTAGRHDELWSKVSRGELEAEAYDVLDSFLDAEHSYLDIGSGVGHTVLYASRTARAVYAVEPDRERYSELQANLALNGRRAAAVVAVLAGVAPCSVEGPCTSFEELRRSQGIEDCRLIRMDIGGDEYRVLPTMLAYLRSERPTLYLSLHPRVRSGIRTRRWPGRVAVAVVGLLTTLRVRWLLRFYRHAYDDRAQRLRLSRMWSTTEDTLDLVFTDEEWVLP